jgi:hypothetical protein
VHSGAVLQPGVVLSYNVVVGRGHAVPGLSIITLCKQLQGQVRSWEGRGWMPGFRIMILNNNINMNTIFNIDNNIHNIINNNNNNDNNVNKSIQI